MTHDAHWRRNAASPMIWARGSPELLRVRTAVSDTPLLERADHLGEGVALLPLVQAGVAELP